MQNDKQDYKGTNKVFAGEEHKESVKQALWNNIEGQIGRKAAPRISWRMAIAASIATVLVSTIVLLTFNKDNKHNEQWIAYTNTSNYTKKIWLADSSCLWIPHYTTVAWSNDYNDKERIVDLRSGECFFEVRKLHDRPFTVLTGNVKTKVLGTSFLVRKDQLNDVTVSVLTGKVSVSRNDSLIRLLLPSDQLTLNQVNGSYQYATVPESDITMWKQGKRVIREQTIASIAIYMQNYYSIHIDIDPLLNRNTDTYTLIYFDGSPLETVMEMLQTVAPNLKIEKENSSNWKWKVDSR